MINVGIIGMGMMGRTHFEAYQQLSNVRVRAICDNKLARALGDLSGTSHNVLKDGVEQISMAGIEGTTDWRSVIAMADVDIIDICVRTTGHVEIALAAIAAGKHVLCEKPLARTAADGRRIVDAARLANTLFMPAMCLRFWPEWVWAKQAVVDGRFGRVLSATFQRLASMPQGWYSDGAQSGGALFDLHIHDVDFVMHLFGKPEAVFTRGYTRTSGELDHLSTHYLYEGPNAPQLVVAEGSWCMADGYEFRMKYIINFEQATLDYDLTRGIEALRLTRNGTTETIVCPSETGYIGECRYFLNCVQRNEQPSVVTGEDAVLALRILEAERQSASCGQSIKID